MASKKNNRSPQKKADGSVLPFPPTPSASTAGVTLQQSKHKRRVEKSRLPKDAPNILIVLLDDVGFGLPDTYGGVIRTPTLTRVANQGISYNRFHTTAICSPTRAALLTGRNHQRVGNGTIAERAVDWDGYLGVIPKTSATLAETLRHYGYKTAAFGKWHNTPADQTTAMGPFDRWPTGHGFDYFYGFMAGETSQWEPRLYENVNPIEPPPRRALPLERRPGRARPHLDEAAPRLRSGQAVFHVLGARRFARAAPHLQGVGRQVQRTVRRRLGRDARAHLQTPEGARLDSGGYKAHATRRHHAGVGHRSRSQNVPSSGA